MRVLRSAGEVAAPRERVFAILEDARMADQLNPPELRTTVVAAPWLPKPGARTQLRVQLRGVEYGLETELAEYRRGHFLLERQVTGPFAAFEHAINVEDAPAGAGASAALLREVVAYGVRFGPLGRLFDALSLRRELEAILAARLHRLRALVGRE